MRPTDTTQPASLSAPSPTGRRVKVSFVQPRKVFSARAMEPADSGVAFCAVSASVGTLRRVVASHTKHRARIGQRAIGVEAERGGGREQHGDKQRDQRGWARPSRRCACSLGAAPPPARRPATRRRRSRRVATRPAWPGARRERRLRHARVRPTRGWRDPSAGVRGRDPSGLRRRARSAARRWSSAPSPRPSGPVGRVRGRDCGGRPSRPAPSQRADRHSFSAAGKSPCL